MHPALIIIIEVLAAASLVVAYVVMRLVADHLRIRRFENACGCDSKEIRLIELLPANDDDDEDLRINLRTVSLTNPERPSYEALSCCWGPLSDEMNVIICEDESIILVGNNLLFALVRFQPSRLAYLQAKSWKARKTYTCPILACEVDAPNESVRDGRV
ncbi:hypothetical protein BDZ45DRAFT_743693 [Acephala macrosclerotiorum]|nr:hypothetical protein BDZ45DRAFT_743693 [Acephala macrosclerotiorum]